MSEYIEIIIANQSVISDDKQFQRTGFILRVS